MKWYTKAARWIWEFPQCLLGLILTKWYDTFKIGEYKEIPIYSAEDMPGGISLGLYVILNEREVFKTFHNDTYNLGESDSVRHEYGHTRDSLRWGPLYLLAIGLPSVTWLLIRRVLNKHRSLEERINYYWFYTERRADKFGGVVRNHDLYEYTRS